jgi:hypothetical protein
MGFLGAILARTHRLVIGPNIGEYDGVITADLPRGDTVVTISQTRQHGDFVRTGCQP